jgi:hypothetical protein
VASVRKRAIPTERHPLVGKVSANFVDTGCSMVSSKDPYDRNLGFLDRSCYFFFQVPPQLYSRALVDPVPDPLFLRKSGSAGNRTRTSGSVARNSNHQITEAVIHSLIVKIRKVVKLSLLQAMDAYGVVRRRGFHIF